MLRQLFVVDFHTVTGCLWASPLQNPDKNMKIRTCDPCTVRYYLVSGAASGLTTKPHSKRTHASITPIQGVYSSPQNCSAREMNLRHPTPSPLFDLHHQCQKPSLTQSLGHLLSGLRKRKIVVRRTSNASVQIGRPSQTIWALRRLKWLSASMISSYREAT